MTHIITRLCLRDTACVEVCPVECMVLGKPEEQWPWPDNPLDQENSCQPLYVRQAVFVKPSPMRT